MDGQVVFPWFLRFSPTFDDLSAWYKWNILESAVNPKSKKKNPHVAPMPPTKFWLSLTYHYEMRFEDFQDGHLGAQGHLIYWNRTILAILWWLWCLPSCLGSIGLAVGEMSFKEFQDGPHGSHLEHRNGTNLAVLNLNVTPMPLDKFQLNPTFGSGVYVVSRFSSRPPWRPSLILERNKFSNSKSPWHPNTHHVCAQANLLFDSRRGLKVFKMATTIAMVEALLDIGTERF